MFIFVLYFIVRNNTKHQPMEIVMMTMKRRESDWQQREELEISCYDLLNFILSDLLPEFGTEGLRDEIWIVSGKVCIPDVTFTSEVMDLSNVEFPDGLYSDNISFNEAVKLSTETKIQPLITHLNRKVA